MSGKTGRASSFRQVRGVGLRVAGNVAEFGGYVLLARSLGPSSFGRISVLLVIVRFVALACDRGVAYAGTREVAGRGADSPAIWAWQRRRESWSLAGTALVALATVAIGWPELAPMALGVFARGASREWIATGQNRLEIAAVPSLVHGAGIVAGVLAVDRIVAGGTTDSSASLIIGAAALLWYATSVAINPAPRGHWSTAGAPAGGHGQVAIFAENLIISLDVVLLAWLVNDRETGIYAAMLRFPNALSLVLWLSITAAVPRVVALARHGGAHDAELRRRCMRLSALLGIGTAAGGAAIATLAVTVFGEEYRDGRSALALLLIGSVALALSAPFRTLQLVAGDDSGVARVSVIIAAFTLTGFVVTIPIWGMNGAAACSAASQVAFLAFFWANTRRGAATAQTATAQTATASPTGTGERRAATDPATA